MSKSERTISFAGRASTLVLCAFALGACAEDAADEPYGNEAAEAQTEDGYDTSVAESPATETYAMNETETDTTGAAGTDRMGDDMSAAAAAGTANAQQAAATLGVSELNDLENWKITHEGQEIGEIDRIGVDRQTGELLAVVGLEGVVGINMKEVGIPLTRLEAAGDETLSTDLTKDELQQKRDIDPWDESNPDDADEEATM